MLEMLKNVANISNFDKVAKSCIWLQMLKKVQNGAKRCKWRKCCKVVRMLQLLKMFQMVKIVANVAK